VVSGLVEKIGAAQGALKHEPAGAEALSLEMPFPDHRAALEKVIELLTNAETGQVRPLPHTPSAAKTLSAGDTKHCTTSRIERGWKLDQCVRHRAGMASP